MKAVSRSKWQCCKTLIVNTNLHSETLHDCNSNTTEIRRTYRPKSWKILTKPFIWSVRNKMWKLWEVNVVKYKNTLTHLEHVLFQTEARVYLSVRLSSWTIGRSSLTLVDTKCSRRDHKSCICLCWLAPKYILLLLTYIRKPYMIAIVTTRKRSSHKNEKLRSCSIGSCQVRAIPIGWLGLIWKCCSIFLGYPDWSLTGRFVHVGRVMSRIERSHENCEIYDISQDHWQSLRNLFKGLLGSPIQSYKNCENYEIYENCEIYDNLQDRWQSLRNLFKGLQEAPSKVTRIAKITKFTKTAKFTQWMKERTRYIYGIYIQLLC